MHFFGIGNITVVAEKLIFFYVPLWAFITRFEDKIDCTHSARPAEGAISTTTEKL